MSDCTLGLRCWLRHIKRGIKPHWVLTLCLSLSVSIVVAEGALLSEELLAYVQRNYGRSARKILLDWQDLIAKNKDKSEREKLKLVNMFFNRRIYFVDDIKHWGKRDYWATPIETMATRGGDCEDFSIAKYFTLREMGVPDERMRITYVKAKRLRQPHMVLTYYPSPGAEPLVLDNLTNRISLASKRRDLVPVYSFNGSSLWMAKERGGGKLVGDANNVKLWRELQLRFKNEKLR